MEIDVSKCEFYNNNYCFCYRDDYGDCYHKCIDEELKNCYYKQLQKSQNTIIVGLQIQIMLLANNSKLNKCLDEIEELIETCNNTMHCKDCKFSENCQYRNGWGWREIVFRKIKEVKGNRYARTSQKLLNVWRSWSEKYDIER